MKDMKIAIIGAGNMGGALARGLVRAGTVAAADITVTARHPSTLEEFASRGFRTATDNRAAVQDAEMIFFCRQAVANGSCPQGDGPGVGL